MKMNRPLVNIILPTYNGEKYLCELLDSLMNQTYKNIKVWIRDDNSTDDTVNILEKYQRNFPRFIEVMDNENKNLGVSNNVCTILRKIDGDYFMICDQDDKWLKNKVEAMLKRIRYYESKNKFNPILVFCDSFVTDNSLKIINRSFIEYEGIDTRKVDFYSFLHANIVQGASCIFNKKVLNIIKASKEKKINSNFMYDWWIATLTSAFGEVHFLNKKLMYYRQHDNNVIGARKKKSILKALLFNSKEDINTFRMRNYTQVNRSLCNEITKNYSSDLGAYQKQILKISMSLKKEYRLFIKFKLYMNYSIKQLLLMAVLEKK